MTSPFSQVLRLAGFCGIWLLLSGCATTHQIVLTGDILVDGPNAIANGPPRDKVLWQYRTAIAAMRQGKFNMAKQYLDDALRAVAGIYGPDSEARKSRGFFHPESKKTFIGEPYERSMAFFYRGVLYWMDGERDNARACFRSAEFEDSDAAEKQYVGDWVLPDYLDGLATVKLGGDGSDALKRARANSRNINLPDYNPKANVLMIVEFGPGPLKYAAGQYEEQLHFRVRPAPVLSAHIRSDGLDFAVAPCDDVNYQATTRGGRVMDYVLANKAVFKSATDTAGNVAIVTGAILASQQGRNSAADEVGLGLLLAGVAAKIVSASTTPQADVRCWEDLPQFISFASVTLPVGEHKLTVEFLDSAGRVLPNLTRSVTVNITRPDRDKVVFLSDRMSSPQTQ